MVVEDESIVSGALEAIEIAKKTKPHLALIDIMLEGKTTGVDAADYIYKHLNIPVVCLTAYTTAMTLDDRQPFWVYVYSRSRAELSRFSLEREAKIK